MAALGRSLNRNLRFARLALAILGSVGGCHTDQVATTVSSTGPARQTATDADRIELEAGPASSGRAQPLLDASDDPGDTTFALVPLLDEARGRRAAVAYRAFLARLCASLMAPGANRAKLKQDVGFGRSALDADLCATDSVGPKALASGAFFEPRADEVLLEVETGEIASTASALALMRADSADYQLVRIFLRGAQFEAKARVTTPGGVDVLMLCKQGGNMGLYPSTCGFLGQGTFREGDGEPWLQNEIGLITTLGCGRHANVTLGAITLSANRLSVGLNVEESFRRPTGSEEGPDMPCSNESQKKESRFTVTYEVHGKRAVPRVRRLAPLPRAVTKVLERED